MNAHPEKNLREINSNINIKAILRGPLGKLALITTMGLSLLTFSTKAESASVDNYPWADAAAVPMPPALDKITWGYTDKATCDAKSSDFDCRATTLGTDPKWYFRDQWGYDLKNCTSYVAWRVAKEFGVSTSGWDDAGKWDNNATGYTVDNTPESGDIAVWDGTASNSYGHVAFVESVNMDGSVNISQFNKDFDGKPSSKSNLRADHYIDINGTGKGLNGEALSSSGSGTGNVWYIGSTTLGVYNAGWFYERNSNTGGAADTTVQFGNSNWMPLSGDWNNDGIFTPGAYDPATGWFYLRDSNTPGPADRAFQYGNIGWTPLSGDWDGNGYWSVGMHDPATSTFYLKNFNGPGPADTVAQFGNGGWKPIVGDWDKNLSTTIGVYDPYNAVYHLNDQNDGSPAERSFQYGNIGWTPLSGDWDGNGYWSVGAHDPITSTFYLKNFNGPGPADITVQYGNGGWKPVVGNWDGR